MANTAPIEARSSAGIAGLDGRTVNARRVRDLAVTYTAALGGEQVLDALQRELVLKAAQLTVAAEDMRRCSLRGETIDVSDLVKLENLASRAVRALNLGKRDRPAPVFDPHSYAARKRAEALENAAVTK